MAEGNSVHQGEILMILVKRSKMDRTEIAKTLNISPQYLSMLFKKSTITKRKRMEIAQFFGVDESVFETGVGYSLPNTTSVAAEDRPELEAELQKLEQENKRLAAQLLREQEINDDLRVLLRRVLGEDAGKSDQDKP